jgi:GNAT superfamily N-acetyltransferase
METPYAACSSVRDLGANMAEFEDREGRTIQLSEYGSDFVAEHEGRRVSIIETTGEIDAEHEVYPPQITGMFTELEYQGAGIALELLKFASEMYGPLTPAARNEGRGNENALTDEGEGLIRRARKLGYVSPFPRDDPDEE